MANAALAYIHKVCKQCSKAFVPKKYQQRCNECQELGGKRVSAISRPCLACSKIFKPADRNYSAKYCSKQCLNCSDIERERQAKKRRKQGIKPRDMRPAYTTLITYKNCAVCLSSTLDKWDKKYCAKCADRYGKDGCKSIARGLRDRQCAACDLKYSAIPPNKAYTCSDKCSDELKRINRRKARSARRAIIRKADRELFDPLEVLERDGWICQGCGTDTPKELRGTYEASAPELDHIIPLSKGGAHTRANTQCLCRACNGIKSDAMPITGREGRV